jgi:hypothetical protein
VNFKGTYRLVAQVSAIAILAAEVSLRTAGVASATGGADMSLPNKPDGYSEVHFYLTINQTPDKRQFFFSNQFYYQDTAPAAGLASKDLPKDLPKGSAANGVTVGYFGLQPRESGPQGFRLMNVAFSSFRSDATPAAARICRKGADLGDGVTCSTIMPFTPGHRYELSISKSGKRFTGTVTDTVTGIPVAAGAYDIASPTVIGINQGFQPFTENYTDYTTGHCNPTGFPYYEVIYGKPEGLPGPVTGTVGAFKFDNSDGCPDAESSEVTDAGSVVKLGYKQ